jgi:hypothetical protein
VVSKIQTWVQAIFQSGSAQPHPWVRITVVLLLGLQIWLGWSPQPALAGLNDDYFDGNIYALYAGNGSLVPPRVTLADSLRQHKPALLVFYVDDSSDCKQFASVVDRVQEFYGRAADLIPIDVDALSSQGTYGPEQPGYYYRGLLPQTVLIDQAGQVVLDEVGQITYERIDDQFREVFNLLPRSESAELRRRPINEFNAELTQ